MNLIFLYIKGVVGIIFSLMKFFYELISWFGWIYVLGIGGIDYRIGG